MHQPFHGMRTEESRNERDMFSILLNLEKKKKRIFQLAQSSNSSRRALVVVLFYLTAELIPSRSLHHLYLTPELIPSYRSLFLAVRGVTRRAGRFQCQRAVKTKTRQKKTTNRQSSTRHDNKNTRLWNGEGKPCLMGIRATIHHTASQPNERPLPEVLPAWSRDPLQLFPGLLPS